MKPLKNILHYLLITGNDWLLHVVVGGYLSYYYGWRGWIASFIVHFPMDAIPHGHSKKYLLEISKGAVVAVVIFLWAWSVSALLNVILVGVGMLISILPDLILNAVKKIDNKKLWEKFPLPISQFVKNVVYFIIWSNYWFHWFGRETKLTFQLKLKVKIKSVMERNRDPQLRLNWKWNNPKLVEYNSVGTCYFYFNRVVI